MSPTMTALVSVSIISPSARISAAVEIAVTFVGSIQVPTAVRVSSITPVASKTISMIMMTEVPAVAVATKMTPVIPAVVSPEYEFNLLTLNSAGVKTNLRFDRPFGFWVGPCSGTCPKNK